MVFQSSGGKQRFHKAFKIPALVCTDGKYGDALFVTYTNDVAVAQAWVDHHLRDRHLRPMAIGWDMESAPSLPWRTTRYEGPATVQLSVLDAAMVLQIAQEDTGPYWENLPLLSDILADASILKVGVGLDQDMLDLIRWPNNHNNANDDSGGGNAIWTHVVGRLDIGGIGGSNGNTKSLKSLANEICGVELVKSRKLAMSNWATSKPHISEEQIAYAARDAWAAIAILEELASRDPNQFSTEALVARLLKSELPIQQLNANALARKEAKLQLKKLLSDEDGNPTERKDLTDHQRDVLGELERIMKELAPPKPFVFEESI